MKDEITFANKPTIILSSYDSSLTSAVSDSVNWPAKMGFMTFRQPSTLCFDAVSFTAVLLYRG